MWEWVLRHDLFTTWVKAQQNDGKGAFALAAYDQQMNGLAVKAAKQQAMDHCAIKPTIVQSWKTHLHYKG